MSCRKSLIVTALFVAPIAVHAQGAVTGVLSLEERRGADRGDPRTGVVWLEARGRMLPASDDGARDASIAMRGREFIPHVRVVRAGGAVAFPNQDPFRHNVFSNAEPGAFDLGLYPRNASRAAGFSRPGVYPIYCNIHSKMVSFVVAVPSPWSAQPDAEGRFALRGVPAGTYVLHAWHERGDEVEREILVTPQGRDDVRVTIDARAYVPGPHLNKFGRPYSVIRADRY